MVSTELLNAIFGSDSVGSTAGARARSSRQQFVRSEDHLGFDSPSATGRRLSAWEAFDTFGIDKLIEVVDYGSAIIAADQGEPAATIKAQRKRLGLTPEEVARSADVTPEQMADAENPDTRTSIHILAKLAQRLQLDDLSLSWSRGVSAGFAYKLRSVRDKQTLDQTTLFGLIEAAWVVARTVRLQTWLSSDHPIRTLADRGFVPDDHFGSRYKPAWKYGYELASLTRELLGIGPDEPIRSMRQLIEETLCIPLVQIEIDQAIAGATIAPDNDQRGIAVNRRGENSKVFVRRATLAHELGHLLWDPEHKFRSLTVDSYDAIFAPTQHPRNGVEARANAFAIEFLAPKSAAVAIFQSYSDPAVGLQAVMDRFGVSFIAARWHVSNGLNTKLDVNRVETTEPSADWEGGESFLVDFFKPMSTPVSRRGRFSFYVADAYRRGLISADSAALYLNCAPEALPKAIDFIVRAWENR